MEGQKEDRLLKALERHRIIAPLTKRELEEAEKREIRKRIIEEEGISERTLRRYVAAYGRQKLEGLKPKERKDKGSFRKVSAEIIKNAAKLKEELKGRSARRIIEILEKEGKAEKGSVSITTVNRHLKAMGMGSRELMRAAEKGHGSRRFQRSRKGSLWQADIKYGPYIPDPDNPGKKKRAYLLAIIDDATRYVVHGEFYLHQRQPILEDGLRKAIIEHGLCETIYIDNGKIFVSQWFRAACAELGIEHLATAPYSPQAKGKIERFNRTMGEFLEEVSLEAVETLKELNDKWRLWLREYYHKRSHRGLEVKAGTKEHYSPQAAWEHDETILRIATAEECRTAFLWQDERTVDKTGCFTLCGITFEAGPEYIRKKIEIRYDPFELERVEVWEENKRVKIVGQLKIKEYNGRKRKEKTNAIEKGVKSGSRLLGALEKEKKEKEGKKHQAISFSKIEKEAADD
jgi:transposase InsO family protein